MTDNICAHLPNKTDCELEIIRRNAQNVLETTNDPLRKKKAEAWLGAIEVELTRRHLPGMIDAFQVYYEGGFYGERFWEEEREYKVAASEACRQLFASEPFRQLIEDANWTELFSRVKKLVNMTNLIQASFERPKLFDKIQTPGVPEQFYPVLYDCLHGPGEPAQRLGRFADVLIDLSLGKWTYASYFIFLYEPDRCMFVKPEGLKKAIDISCYPLEYEPQPSEELYTQILAYSSWLKDKISILKPRDMIDVQSFIWHMAPTGIYAKE